MSNTFKNECGSDNAILTIEHYYNEAAPKNDIIREILLSLLRAEAEK